MAGSRGELPLPAAARTMCGITVGRPVLLAAFPSADMLVIHPASVIAELLAALHTQAIGGTVPADPARVATARQMWPPSA